jgi:hypothetical protein
MMQQTSFIDSRRNSQLKPNHFPSLCTIQAFTDGTDSGGQPTKIWADVPGLTNIPCLQTLSSGRLVLGKEQTYGTTTHRISLAGNYPQITRLNQAIISGTVYRIQYVDASDYSNSVTVLECEVVT